MPFKLTTKQQQANDIIATNATHAMLFGGSRSGKTFLLIRNIVLRALKAPSSRHVILRFAFNHIKGSIIFDTFPKVMKLAFPQVKFVLNKTDWFVKFPNGSEIWFGGLDDKDRTEKILGNEYVTIYLNECSQISLSSRNLVVTRLAQKIYTNTKGLKSKMLIPRMFYDCNPPAKGHWTYKIFIKKIDPNSNQPLRNQEDFVSVQMNPVDNTDNLSKEYLHILENLSSRERKRFLEGEFADENPNALFNITIIDSYRLIDGRVPQLTRVVIAVDPSGADDSDNGNDAIGIIVAGLGVDGKCYILEDCTVTASPKVWGQVATSAYDRHQANIVVGESNYGGAMVKHVIQTARPNTPYSEVRASRGKAVRAEPVSALYEQGKVVHVGYFRELEDELMGFSTHGFIGEKSPNRADALIWAITALFPAVINPPKKEIRIDIPVTNLSF